VRRLYKLGQRNVATVALVSLGLGAVLAVIATISFFNERDIESQITREVRRVESPCLQHGPRSPQCHESFGTALEALNEVLTPQEARIIVCRSLLFDQLKACRKVRQIEAVLKQSEEQERQAGQVATVNGDAESTGNPGSSLPGRHEGGSGKAGHPEHHHPSKVPGESGGGGEDVPSPAKEASEGPTGSTSPPVTERVGSTVVETTPEASVVQAPKAPVREAVGGVVESAGGIVAGTVEGVTETTCVLAKVLCP
jgi:hypothetical protein